jgi:hypothetical protein
LPFAPARAEISKCLSVLIPDRDHALAVDKDRNQIYQITESIWRFGFTNPVLISDDDQIICPQPRDLTRIRPLSNNPRTAYGINLSIYCGFFSTLWIVRIPLWSQPRKQRSNSLSARLPALKQAIAEAQYPSREADIFDDRAIASS